MKQFIKNHVQKIKPLNKQAALAYWEAAIKGDDELYAKAAELELKIRRVYSSAEDFAFLKSMKESGKIEDALLTRQLDILYNAYLENQIEPELLEEMVLLGTEIEKKFSNFRAVIDDKKVSSNEIDEILKNETDSKKRKQAWLASKQVGPIVGADIIKLVKLRNKAAKSLEFDNFHTMSLTLDEQKVEELDKVFSELHKLTNKPYAELKSELDNILADMYGVGPEELKPWHYHDPFFQETPLVYDLDLDKYYKGKKLEKIAAKFFKGIGLPVKSILKNSDLYERESKNPHAFCTDIDRKGDVRILCNIKETERWMETTLHELGHAVYDKYHNSDVPYLLREPAHIFTTEGIAMFFGRLSRNPEWMRQMLKLTDEQKTEIEKVSGKYARLKQLIFARWAMVMYDFEKELYADPEQDLNELWWNTVEKYQLIEKPFERNAPDWAAKIHFAIAPCYYHNYLLGELFASQLDSTFRQLEKTEDILHEEIGLFLKDKVFGPGKIHHWNEMIASATGEPLTAKYFVDQFVK